MNEEARIREALESAETIAVVGCSPNPMRPSNEIASYLLEAGYRVVPVNPGHREILGQPCYRSLEDIPGEIRVDIVDVFRRAEHTPDIARSAVALRCGTLWLQLGVISDEAARIAHEGGVCVVMDRWTAVDHRVMREVDRGR